MPVAIPIAMVAASALSSYLASRSAEKAADQQATAQGNALSFEEQQYQQNQANQAPFVQAGTTSLGHLMTDLGNGTFGAGSLGAVPQFTGTFTAPTLAEAQQTPGYQFAAQQGSKGILQGAGAAGGAISGGTLQALDSYNTNLANSTYGDVFSRALQTYNAGISGYQAQLAGYQTSMGAQQQAYNQMLAPAQLGESAATATGNTGTLGAVNIGNVMTGIGNAQAAGTVGSSNAITAGITGATNTSSQTLMLNQLMKALNIGGSSSPYTQGGPSGTDWSSTPGYIGSGTEEYGSVPA